MAAVTADPPEESPDRERRRRFDWKTPKTIRRTRVRDRAQAVAYAFKRGLT
jgi:hypothetical protein